MEKSRNGKVAFATDDLLLYIQCSPEPNTIFENHEVQAINIWLKEDDIKTAIAAFSKYILDRISEEIISSDSFRKQVDEIAKNRKIDETD